MDKKEVEDILSEFGLAPASTSKGKTIISDKEADNIFKEFGLDVTGAKVAAKPAKRVVLPEDETASQYINRTIQSSSLPVRAGLSAVRGIGNVADTLAEGIGYVGERGAAALEKAGIVSPEGYKAVSDWKKGIKNAIAEERKDYEAATKGDLTSGIGEIAGEIAATAPLMPARVVQGITKLAGAAPRITATGEKIVAPWLNRLMANTAIGTVGGAQYGTLTASKNEKSLLRNVAEATAFGAIGGPVVSAASSIGSAAVRGIGNLWSNININKIAQANGLEPSAVKNIVTRLEEVGIGPTEAIKEMRKLGPKATLADLAESLTTEVGGLASMGGRNANILKGRYGERADEAGQEIYKKIEQRLGGPKPDLVAEKEAIKQKAFADTKADYDAAKATGGMLDASPIIKNIDDALLNAAGSKQAALAKIKSYFYRTIKDADGNLIKELKTELPALHEVRIALDDLIEKAGSPTTSMGSRAKSAVKNVRDEVDDLLKSNPSMAKADAKFAEQMKIVEGLDFGFKSISKAPGSVGINKEEFAKVWDAATPEIREAIKKGQRAAIGDILEGFQRGELSGAQALFGKKAVNKINISKSFGFEGDALIDDVLKATTFKEVENSILHNSKTAERLSVQERYKAAGKTGLASDIVQGAAMDAATLNMSGAATAIMAARRGFGQAKLKMGESRLERLTEGTSDILSRQEKHGRDAALSVASRVKAIQDGRFASSTSKAADRIRDVRLPVALPSILTEKAYDKSRKAFRY